MPNFLELKAPAAQTLSAAVAITDEFLYFVEIDEENNPVKKISVPIAEGCIVNGQIKNFAFLESAFMELRRQTGKINGPVSIGLPEGETIIRFPNLPDMSMEDVRGTLDLNFQEYFPYPRQEAVFDAIKIKHPSDKLKDDITVMAAAAKTQVVDKVLETAHNAGITPGPVEPTNFAIIRAIPEAHEGLSVLAGRHNIITIWQGYGIFFRIGNNKDNFQDVLNTIQFAETQYRGIHVEKIILSGLDFNISSEQSSIKVINITDEYCAAIGLAMRDEPGLPPLDLRPVEFVELEKRRYSFNINRIILWGLIVTFLMLSIGTISFTFACIRDLNEKISLMRESVQDLSPQRDALTRQNAELERQNAQNERILKFLQEDMPTLEVMSELEINGGHGVKFDSAFFSKGNAGGWSITLDGKAEDEARVLAMTEGLKRGGKFSSVMLPVSQQDQTGRVSFRLILEMGGEENNED